MNLREILENVAGGTMPIEEAERFLDSYGFVQVGHHRLDLHRERRTPFPEVVLGLAKSTEQLREIIGYYAERSLPLLVTKIDEGKAAELLSRFSELAYERQASILRIGRSVTPTHGTVAIVSAGSSDLSIAEEAAATLEFFGPSVTRLYDCGVAGLHRLFAAAPEIESADVIIVVAGMEGALPSVVAGLFRQPVIAVPTSVGYGGSFEGLSALLGMMNSCAPGVTVVNIDNGFGAAAAARSMLLLSERRTTRALLEERNRGGSS